MCKMINTNPAQLRCMTLFFGFLYLSLGIETCYAQDQSSDMKKLLKERRDLLSQAVDSMNLLLGRVPLQELLRADRDSLKADLDWFDKHEDRIRAIEKHKKAADIYWQTAKTMQDAGRGFEYIVIQAKAYVVEIQIELLKEKERQKAKPGK